MTAKQRYDRSFKGAQRARRYERTPQGRYVRHRQNARNRGVPFLLTFEEWWSVWKASGYWTKRGNKKGQYQMCRMRDAGPYAVGNVYIAKCEQNTFCRNTVYGRPGSSERVIPG